MDAGEDGAPGPGEAGPAARGPARRQAEAARRGFRQFRYEDARGPRDAFRRLWELGRRWLRPDARPAERVLELLVVEQFLAILPEAARARARGRWPDSGAEAVALAARWEREAGRAGPRVSAGGGGRGGPERAAGGARPQRCSRPLSGPEFPGKKDVRV